MEPLGTQSSGASRAWGLWGLGRIGSLQVEASGPQETEEQLAASHLSQQVVPRLLNLSLVLGYCGALAE